MSRIHFTAKTIIRLLKELNSLIDIGYEFPDAIDHIVDEYHLTKAQYQKLINVYDSQSAEREL